MITFTDISQFSAHCTTTLGIRPALKAVPFGTISVSLLGQNQKDSKGRMFFDVGGIRVFLASDANVIALKGELSLLSGTKDSLKSEENPTGEWKLVLIK